MTRILHAFGVTIEIVADQTDLFPLLEARLPPLVPPGDAEPTIRYTVTTSASGQRVAVRGRRTVVMADSLDTLCDHLVTDLQSELARAAHGWTFIHAGVVAIDGRAIVLPAPSGGGKTTLVAALIRSGAEYASDEFAVIDRLARVHPYARPLRVRTPGQRLRSVPAAELGAASVKAGVPIGVVLFVDYQPSGFFETSLLPGGRVAAGLLRHCLGARGRPRETLRALRLVTTIAPGCAGTRGDAAAAAEQILARARSGEWA